MNTDKYFEIGSTHDVCQDFSLVGKTKHLTFAIVADGCSESHKLCGEVDFGARVMAYLARDAIFDLDNEMGVAFFLEDKKDLDRIGEIIRAKITRKIIPIKDQLRLHDLFSDSTVVIAITDNKLTFVYMFGDGGVITVRNDGEIEYNEISYLSSAPYYLSYLLDDGRNKAYQSIYGISPVTHSQYIIPFDGIENLRSYSSINKNPEINKSIYEFSSFIFKDIVSVSVVSDGIKSFQEVNNGMKSINAIDMVPKFIGFKNTHGLFVQRRMNFFKKENRTKNIVHYDDISIASIAL